LAALIIKVSLEIKVRFVFTTAKVTFQRILIGFLFLIIFILSIADLNDKEKLIFEICLLIFQLAALIIKES
jgi:hypothetical protein